MLAGEMIATEDTGRRDAAQLVREFRHVVVDLLRPPWDPRSPFIDGIRMVAEQLLQLEATPRESIDDALILELLPIVDAIERARRQALTSAPYQVRRFNVALDGFVRAMMRFGVHPERPLGTPFDPNIHEAVGDSKPLLGSRGSGCRHYGARLVRRRSAAAFVQGRGLQTTSSRVAQDPPRAETPRPC